jgi:HEAT repeat protein
MTIRHHQTIDQTLAERQGIKRLLDRVQDAVSDEELEEIGASLKTAGTRALNPLVRRIWHERRGDQLTRYAYLLDFFEDETWLEELVQMALTRQDLEQEGRQALLQVLEGYGIDTAALPLAGVAPLGAAPASEILPTLFALGESGLVRAVGDILSLEPEARPEVVADLAQVRDPRVVELLAVLAGVDDPDIAAAAVAGLGRVREPAAVAALTALQQHPDEQVRRQADISLRRLAFLGVADGQAPAAATIPRIQDVYVGTFDGNGNLTLCLAFAAEGGLLTTLFLHLHEVKGLCTAIGYRGVTADFFAHQLEGLRQEEGLLAVPVPLALALLRDAIQRSRAQELFLPPEYYVFRGLLAGRDHPPQYHEPVFADVDLPKLATSSRHRAVSAALLDDEFFADWLLTERRVYGYAEQWRRLDEQGDRLGLGRLVDEFCAELLQPRLERLVRRLFLSAELLLQAGREPRLTEMVLATAAALQLPGPLAVRHPFLKRLAVESITSAGEVLDEGYDPRLQPEMDDYWDEGGDWEQ